MLSRRPYDSSENLELTVTGVSVVLVLAVMIYGYFANLYVLFHGGGNLAQLALRALGAIVIPLGCALGYF
jgi:hypothetical protein